MGVLVYDVPHAAIADAEAGDIGAVATITNTTRFAAIFLPGTYGPVSLLTFGPYIAGAGALTGGASALAGAGTLTITGTSALVGGAAVLSGAGTLTITGAGALTAGAAALAGVGTHTAPTVPNIPGTTTGTFAPTGQTTGTFAPTGTTTGVQGP